MTSHSRARSLALALAALGLASARPLPAQTGLTIYSDGRVLVRRTLTASVPAGVSNHRLELGALDPATVFALDSAVTVVGAAYDDAVDEANTMRRAIGLTLKFLRVLSGGGTPLDTVAGTVIGVNPERFRLADGRIVFERPGLPLYPAELMLADPTLALAVRAPAQRPSLRLGYFTRGASWNANYSVVLGKGAARLSGQAVIPSQSLRESDAEVQLLAGSVGRASEAKGFQVGQLNAARAVAEMAPMAPATEEGVGEAHLYSIPGKVSLQPGTTTTVALFEPAMAPWTRSFVVRGQIPWYGPLQQYGDIENEVPVEVWYTLKRQAKTAFGDLPLPGGAYRLYEPDAQGRLQLIGESSAGHAAPGQDVRLPAGTAFDLTAKRIQTSYSTQRDSTRRTIAMAGYRVTVANAKDSTATVEVLEERGGEWAVIASSVPPEKLSSTRTRFTVRVPAHGEATLTYRVRVVW